MLHRHLISSFVYWYNGKDQPGKVATVILLVVIKLNRKN